MTPLERDAPPVGEEIHLPGPSIQPVLLTVGLAPAVVRLAVADLSGAAAVASLIPPRVLSITEEALRAMFVNKLKIGAAVLLTVGVTLALVGLTFSPILLWAGVALALVVTVRWIRDVVHDIDQLPLEHKE